MADTDGQIDIGGQIAAVNNLETARMSLRWALERVSALEQRNAELARRLAEAEKTAHETDQERRGLKRALALRAEEDEKRESYYHRMQEFISIRLSGHPDAAKVAGRELELARMQEELFKQKLLLEKEFGARADALRLEYEQLKAAVEDQARAQAQRTVDHQARRQREVEQLLEKKDQELRQKASELERGAREEAARRLEENRAALADEKAAAAADAASAQAALAKAVREWQGRVEQQRAGLLDLERQLDQEREALREQTRQKEAQARAMEQERLASVKVLESLKAEIQLWRGKAEEAQDEAAQARKDAAAADGERRRLSKELEAERQRRETAERRVETVEQTLARRQAELDRASAGMIDRLKDFEEEAQRRDVAWREREEALRRRDQDWRRKQSEWQRAMSDKAEQIEVLKQELQQTIRSYAGSSRMGRKDHEHERKPDA